jgi:hypothetical protein
MSLAFFCVASPSGEWHLMQILLITGAQTFSLK